LQDADRKQGRGAAIGLIAVILALFIIVNSDTELSVWVALILRPFMHGVSLFKTNFLLFFLLIVAALEFFPAIVPSKKTVTGTFRITLFAVSAAGLMGMATFWELTTRMHVPLDRYAYYFDNGYVSINHFAHLHVTKAGLYHLVTALGLGEIANHADTGLPFAGLVNPAVAVTILILAAVTMIALIVAAPAVMRTWSGKNRIFAIILYALAASHTVKCQIDGGPLSYDFLPSVVVTLLMLSCARGESLSGAVKKYWSRILVATLIFLFIIATFSPDIALVLQPQQYLFFYGIYFLLLIPLLQLRLNKFLPRLIGVLAAGWCLFYYYQQTIPDILILQSRLSSQATVSLIDPENAALNGAPKIRDVSSASPGKRIAGVYRVHAQKALRNRTLLIKTPGDSQYGGFLFALRLLRADSILHFENDPQLTFHGITAAGANSDSLYVFRVEFGSEFFPSLWTESPSIVDENNKFAAMFYLDLYFRRHGLREYLLVPLYYEATA